MKDARHLLLIEAGAVRACAWQRGRLEARGSFAADPEGQARFAAYVEARPDCDFRLLADPVDDAYIHETLPFLLKRDRQPLLARKLEQHFPGTPLRLACSLGHEKARRKNERLLLCALLQPAACEPWLGILQARGNAVSGVHSLAQLAGVLASRLGRGGPPALLFDCLGERPRASFISDGLTRYSRKLGNPPAGGARAGWLEAEAQRLESYLRGQGLIGAGDVLPVLLLADGEPPAAAEGGRQIARLSSASIAERLGLAMPADLAPRQAIFLQLLARHAPTAQFAPPVLLRQHRLMRIEKCLLRAGLALLVGSLPLAGIAAWQGRQAEQAGQLAEQQIAQLEARERELTARLGEIAADPPSLRQLADEHADWQSRHALPVAALQALGRGLESEPAIALEQLEWKNLALQRSTVAAAGEILISLRGRVLPRAAADTEPLAQLERLREQLRGNPEIETRLLHPPYPDPRGGPAAFALEVRWRPAP